MEIRCKTHPRYRGIYRHRTDCVECDKVYYQNHGQNSSPTPQFSEAEPSRPGFFSRMLRVIFP